MQIGTTSRRSNFIRTLLKVSVIVWGDCSLYCSDETLCGDHFNLKDSYFIPWKWLGCFIFVSISKLSSNLLFLHLVYWSVGKVNEPVWRMKWQGEVLHTLSKFRICSHKFKFYYAALLFALCQMEEQGCFK
jgi:hypothetical protein